MTPMSCSLDKEVDARPSISIASQSAFLNEIELEGELTLGEPKLLLEKSGVLSEYSGFDVAPDGQRFVMIEEGESQPAPTQLVLIQNWDEELKRLVPTN